MAIEKRLIAYDPITFESFTRYVTKHREPDACQYDMGYVDAVDQIGDWMDANTVDANGVTIPVLCKDCKKCTTINNEANGKTILFCEHWKGYPKVEQNGFCYWGERKN